MRQTTRTLAPLAGVGAGIAIGTLAYARWVERLRIEVKRMEVTVDSPGVPAGGLRILHLSDMHFTGRDRIERLKIERTIKLLAGEQVDLLLVTGDLIHDTDGLPATLDLIDRLPRPRLGAFACLGNHDYSCYSWFGPARVAWREAEPAGKCRRRRAHSEMVARVFKNDRLYLGQDHNDIEALKQPLRQHGVHLLDNSNWHVQANGVDLWLTGVDDLMEGTPDVAGARWFATPAGGPLRILLAHNPDHMLEPALHQVNLAFCGHVHGGQILIPGLGAIHTQGTHLPWRKPSGWFHYGEAKTYVSRGLGEGIRLRFNCRRKWRLFSSDVLRIVACQSRRYFVPSQKDAIARIQARGQRSSTEKNSVMSSSTAPGRVAMRRATLTSILRLCSKVRFRQVQKSTG